jgi:endonuclease/exonuclease/phosphatase (EEP) superfamily protein YafD
LFAAAGLLLLLASPLHINRTVPFAALLGPRNAMTALTCAGSVMAVAISVSKRCRPVAAPLALVMLVLTLASGTVIISRGSANPEPAPSAPGQLRILSWNTNGGLVSPSVIAALTAQTRADVVVLPDADIAWMADTYRGAFHAVNRPMRLYADPGATAQLAVFIASSYASHYGSVAVGPDPDKTIRITSNSSVLPTIVAVHTAQPTLHNTALWNSDLNWVGDQCRSGQVIAAGDFNATVDAFGASSLGNCLDTATALGSASVGTWPTMAPTWLGMPLDHVLATPGWYARTTTILTDQDGSGARHRPIFTVLTRATHRFTKERRASVNDR